MTLFVAKENRAKNLYERQGYRVTKEEDGCCIAYCAVGMRVSIFLFLQNNSYGALFLEYHKIKFDIQYHLRICNVRKLIFKREYMEIRH